jgi:hypothetical protein
MANFEKWTMEKGERYDEPEKVYMEVTKQYGRYLKHVVPYVGGIIFKEIRQGDNQPASKEYVSKTKQKQAMNWLLMQLRSYDQWLTPKSLIQKLEVDMNVNDKLRSQIVTSLMNATVLYRIKEGGQLNPKTGYKLDDYLNDLTNSLFIAPKGGVLSPAERDLENDAVSQMIRTSGLAPTEKSSSLSYKTEPEGTLEDATCSVHDDSFFRVNIGLSTLTKDEMGAAMMGRLNRVLQKYRTYRNSATGLTRDFYNYQILKIEKTLSSRN